MKTIEKADPEVVFKVGKHRFYRFSYIEIVCLATGLSKTRVKQLFKDGAIDIYIPEK